MDKFYRYKPFGVLRFVLALLVLIQHFSDTISPLPIKQAVFPWAPGNVAVLGFFMMSGFIICEACHFNYRGRPIAYLKNRLLRIVPAYWAAVLLSIAVHFCLFWHSGHLIGTTHQELGAHVFDSKNIVKNIFAFVPGTNLDPTDRQYPFFGYFWALQTEMMFYLVVFAAGCAYALCQRYVKWSYEQWLAIAGFMGLALAVTAQLEFLPHKLVYGGYFVFGGALFYFLYGKRSALYLLVPAFLQMLWHFHSAEAADFVAIAPNRLGQLLLLGIFLIGFVGLARVHIERAKIDKWFGGLTYSLYLNHFVVSIVILNLAASFSLEYLLDGFVASLVLAWGMAWLIEKPMIGIRRAIRHNRVVEVSAGNEAENAVS